MRGLGMRLVTLVVYWQASVVRGIEWVSMSLQINILALG